MPEEGARKHDSTLMTMSVAPHDWALAGKRIGDEGARALAEALRHNSILKELNLIGEPHPIPPRHIIQ